MPEIMLSLCLPILEAIICLTIVLAVIPEPHHYVADSAIDVIVSTILTYKSYILILATTKSHVDYVLMCLITVTLAYFARIFFRVCSTLFNHRIFSHLYFISRISGFVVFMFLLVFIFHDIVIYGKNIFPHALDFHKLVAICEHKIILNSNVYLFSLNLIILRHHVYITMLILWDFTRYIRRGCLIILRRYVHIAMLILWNFVWYIRHKYLNYVAYLRNKRLKTCLLHLAYQRNISMFAIKNIYKKL